MKLTKAQRLLSKLKTNKVVKVALTPSMEIIRGQEETQMAAIIAITSSPLSLELWMKSKQLRETNREMRTT